MNHWRMLKYYKAESKIFIIYFSSEPRSLFWRHLCFFSFLRLALIEKLEHEENIITGSIYSSRTKIALALVAKAFSIDLFFLGSSNESNVSQFSLEWPVRVLSRLVDVIKCYSFLFYFCIYPLVSKFSCWLSQEILERDLSETEYKLNYAYPPERDEICLVVKRNLLTSVQVGMKIYQDWEREWLVASSSFKELCFQTCHVPLQSLQLFSAFFQVGMVITPM